MVGTTLVENSEYPMQLKLKGKEFTLRHIELGDDELVSDYAKSLPHHDMVYMRRNLSTKEGVASWFRAISGGYTYAFAVMHEGKIVGYSSINLTGLDWSKHVADIRVSVGPQVREFGLGRILVREAFKLAVTLGIEIVRASMTIDQKGARALFEELGFKNEAVLKDNVKDMDGVYHDLLLMAVNVDAFLAQRQAYGLQ